MNKGWVRVRKHRTISHKYFLGDEEWLQKAEWRNGKLLEVSSISIPFSELRGFIIPMGITDEATIHRYLNPHTDKSLDHFTEEEDEIMELTDEQLKEDKKHEKKRIKY